MSVNASEMIYGKFFLMKLLANEKLWNWKIHIIIMKHTCKHVCNCAKQPVNPVKNGSVSCFGFASTCGYEGLWNKIHAKLVTTLNIKIGEIMKQHNTHKHILNVCMLCFPGAAGSFTRHLCRWSSFVFYIGAMVSKNPNLAWNLFTKGILQESHTLYVFWLTGEHIINATEHPM